MAPQLWALSPERHWVWAVAPHGPQVLSWVWLSLGPGHWPGTEQFLVMFLESVKPSPRLSLKL